MAEQSGHDLMMTSSLLWCAKTADKKYVKCTLLNTLYWKLEQMTNSANGGHVKHYLYVSSTTQNANTHFDLSGNAVMSFPHATQDAVHKKENCSIFRNYY